MIHSLRDDVIHDSFTFFSRDSWFKIPLPPPVLTLTNFSPIKVIFFNLLISTETD